jgi:acetylornithine aminotransferase/acetylornithine/N-succinyldiaminopimelate aminotransferase
MRDATRYLANTYQRPPLVFIRGNGCYLYDHTGRKYLDFLGGIAVNALGYSHPRITRVIRRESARAIHVSNLFHNLYQGPLAHKLAQLSGMDRVFFTNSGTEAVEGALKLARLAAHKRGMTNKTRFLALEHSFHGRTFGALSVTHPLNYREPFEPLVPGVDFVRINDVAGLEAKFDGSVCAIIMEVLQGEGGIYPVNGHFWTRARELATQHGAVLIADEIQSGLGRTGRPFAYQRHMGLPDMVLVAKPLAGGLPLGAILARESVAESISPGLHGTTFGGGPLSCATALEFLSVLEEECLLDNVRARGAQLRAGLSRLTAEFDFIREIRGEGLMLGLDLTVDGRPYAKAALDHGLLINCTHNHVLRLLPPFIVSERQVSDFLVRFREVLAKTRRPAPFPPEAGASSVQTQTGAR